MLYPTFPNIFLSSKFNVESVLYNKARFDSDISIIGKITNTELNNNTLNISTISGSCKYITSTSGNKILNSRLKIQDIDNSALYTVMLSNDDSDTSYIKSSLNVSRDMTIGGILTDTPINNTID